MEKNNEIDHPLIEAKENDSAITSNPESSRHNKSRNQSHETINNLATNNDRPQKFVQSCRSSRKFMVIPAVTPQSSPSASTAPSEADFSSLSPIANPDRASSALNTPTVVISTPTPHASVNFEIGEDGVIDDSCGYAAVINGLVKQSDAIYQQRSSESPINRPAQMVTASSGSDVLCAAAASSSSSSSPPIASISPSLAVNLRPKHHNSMRSVRSAHVTAFEGDLRSSAGLNPGSILRTGSYIFSDSLSAKIFTDATSIRSLASIGLGSTDGKRMVIRKVPNSPTELLSIVSPTLSSPPGYDEDDDSFDFSDDPESSHLKPRRQFWANKMQFVLACVGYSVGLGNVWRFPYLCYKSGGGVFLVPYFIILIICGIPMLFMELSIGQYTGRGPIGALGQICPIFKGAGLASVVVSFLMSTYYSVIIAYAIYYFFTSFKPIMPWTDCDGRWNTPDCWIPKRLNVNMTRPNFSRTPSEEFFENKVLQISQGIADPGQMRWELVACLICAWILVYFAIWKSIKSSAKVRYITATFPFVLIIVFMFRALTLDGALDGLRFFLKPKWELLQNANVWINAAAQNFNSLGIAFGSMISFASYNKYNNNILHDTLAVSAVNAITSILVGIFAFATLGNLALEQSTNVEEVISDGPGFIFIVYPQVMAKMPAGQMWAVMFFFMLLCLGLNSQFAIVEVVVTSIQDGFPNWIKRKLVYHELLVLLICTVSFFFGLPNLIQGGIYFFQLIDHYAASISIMFLAFFQMIAIGWFYGVTRLSKNVKQMTGKSPSLYFRSCWFFFGPLLLFCLWIFSLVNYEPPTYYNGKYQYPGWAHGIGWLIAGSSLACIPAYAVFTLIRADGNGICDKLKSVVTPNIYECKICGEHHCEHDFPDEQYMLPQELTPIIQPSLVLKSPPPGRTEGTITISEQQTNVSNNEKS